MINPAFSSLSIPDGAEMATSFFDQLFPGNHNSRGYSYLTSMPVHYCICFLGDAVIQGVGRAGGDDDAVKFPM